MVHHDIFPQPESIQQYAATLEAATQPGGVLHEAAHELTGGFNGSSEAGASLTLMEAAEAIQPRPQPGQEQPRFALVENAPQAKKDFAGAHPEEIGALADTLGLRREQSLDPNELRTISADPSETMWVIEGGANKTSVVRRELAIQAAQEVYSDDADAAILYQLGSDRPIRPTVVRGGEEVENPEYKVAQAIAPDYAENVRDEHSLNLATAYQSGYEVVAQHEGYVEMMRPGSPRLRLVKVARDGGLRDGLGQLADADADFAGKRLVIATNGQYRAKDAVVAQAWAQVREIPMATPLVLGDEAGFQVEHNGATLTTAARGPLVYLNEAAILAREVAATQTS